MVLCEYCKIKKVGIIQFPCKCEYKKLCIKCRLPCDHNCSYDCKKEWKEKLEKNLPIIIGDKLTKV
jgi:hypothetical protein